MPLPNEPTLPDIQLLTNYREPQPEFEAMYLLMPTTQNVDRVIRDFTNRQQYAAAHLFFTEGTRTLSLPFCQRMLILTFPCLVFCVSLGLSEELFQRLTASPAEPYLRALKELFLNFWGMFGLAYVPSLLLFVL